MMVHRKGLSIFANILSSVGKKLSLKYEMMASTFKLHKCVQTLKTMHLSKFTILSYRHSRWWSWKTWKDDGRCEFRFFFSINGIYIYLWFTILTSHMNKEKFWLCKLTFCKMVLLFLMQECHSHRLWTSWEDNAESSKISRSSTASR